MSRMVHDENDPIGPAGRMEIDAEDRAYFTAIAAKLALWWACVISALFLVVALLARALGSTVSLVEGLAALIGLFIMIYLGVFLWCRHRWLSRAQHMMDAHNARMRAEWRQLQELQEELRDGRAAEPSRLAEQRSES